jgi:hypothetical protein
MIENIPTTSEEDLRKPNMELDAALLIIPLLRCDGISSHLIVNMQRQRFSSSIDEASDGDSVARSKPSGFSGGEWVRFEFGLWRFFDRL